MTLFITNKCTNCGMCELECPNQAILFGKHHYEIDSNFCTECIGYYKSPTCQKVCPISNTIIKVVENDQ